MATVRVLILRAAGTNCDVETAYAWQLAGADPERLHVNLLLREPQRLRQYQVLTIPGGFSYGDDIAAGRILANQLLHHLAEELRQFRDRGGLILGICNGFQVLAKAGLLPGAVWSGSESKATVGAAGRTGPLAAPSQAGTTHLPSRAGQSVTLTWNDSGRFEDRWVWLKVATDRCVFLKRGAMLYLPIAHAEGKLVCADETVRQCLHDEGLVALQYVDEAGRFGGYPINPNGSEDHIAGLTDPTGRVLGLMPHPERFVHPTQHPHWSRLFDGIAPHGRSVFQNALSFLAQA